LKDHVLHLDHVPKPSKGEMGNLLDFIKNLQLEEEAAISLTDVKVGAVRCMKKTGMRATKANKMLTNEELHKAGYSVREIERRSTNQA
jgi:hypothetical protein